jgi:polar amino acid transport system substrate-binding protein
MHWAWSLLNCAFINHRDGTRTNPDSHSPQIGASTCAFAQILCIRRRWYAEAINLHGTQADLRCAAPHCITTPCVVIGHCSLPSLFNSSERRPAPQPGMPMKLSRRPFTLLTTMIAIGAAVLAMTSPCVQAQAALDGVMAKKLITIAIPTDFPPYGFVGPDMNPQGLDIDMAKLIGARLGVKVDLVPVTSTNRIPYLQTKKADLVISTLGKNAEREKVIDFTAAYSPFFQAVFAAKSLSIKSMADLGGKSVGVTRGAIEDIELSKNAPTNADIKRFEDNNATVSAFVSGQVQAIATGASVAGNMMQRNPQLNAEYKLLLKDSPNYIGVGKGEDKLRLKVNEVIAAAKAAGELEKLAQKWLGRPAGDLPN